MFFSVCACPAPRPTRQSPSSLVDAHCHLAGQGSNGSGCYLSPSLRRPLLHPLSALKKQLFLTASGVSGSDADCDLRFAEVLAQLKRHCGPEEGAPHGRCHVLALDEVSRAGRVATAGQPPHAPRHRSPRPRGCAESDGSSAH